MLKLARELLGISGRTPLGGDPEITRVTGPCRQAIGTRFHGPTDKLDPRITARCDAGSITVVWDDSLDERDNHAMAAAALAVRLEWCTFATFASHYAMGSTRDGYTFVDIYSRADLQPGHVNPETPDPETPGHCAKTSLCGNCNPCGCRCEACHAMPMYRDRTEFEDDHRRWLRSGRATQGGK